MSHETLFFGGFLLLIFLLLAVDLGVFNRQSHEVSFKEATIWTVVWVIFALVIFLLIRFYGDSIHSIDSFEKLQAINVAHHHGLKLNSELGFAANVETYRHALSLEFISGYLIEYALSVDNIFVIILIFISFSVPRMYYHRVLFWGIIGAILMRFIFIFLSAALIQRFEWIMWLFGAFLIFTGMKMFFKKENNEPMNVSQHPVVKVASRFFGVYPRFVKGRFFIVQNNRFLITPLLLVLLVIEFTDVLFAVDSVPAVFSVTKDPYIVFASNICAIIGLRSLFFLISGIMGIFHYLKTGLAVLLSFIGVKMLLESALHIHINTSVSLSIIFFILLVSILASVIFPKKEDFP